MDRGDPETEEKGKEQRDESQSNNNNKTSNTHRNSSNNSKGSKSYRNSSNSNNSKQEWFTSLAIGLSFVNDSGSQLGRAPSGIASVVQPRARTFTKRPG